jgi:hypothetical protein
VFIPDLSAWFKLGKTLRVGGGAMGLFIEEWQKRPCLWCSISVSRLPSVSTESPFERTVPLLLD